MGTKELVNELIEYCINNKYNKIYICWNGGSGKTTLSYDISNEAEKYGNVNIISCDDFIVDTNVRKNAVVKREENGKKYSYRYTSSNFESYFLKNIYELIYNIDNGVDCFYFPKKYKEWNNIRKLYANYFLTIIEGVGTAFLEREDKALKIFLKCSTEDEIKRRQKRYEESKISPITLYDEERDSLYRTNILINENEFDLTIISKEYFSYEIVKNNQW